MDGRARAEYKIYTRMPHRSVIIHRPCTYPRRALLGPFLDALEQLGLHRFRRLLSCLVGLFGNKCGIDGVCVEGQANCKNEETLKTTVFGSTNAKSRLFAVYV